MRGGRGGVRAACGAFGVIVAAIAGCSDSSRIQAPGDIAADTRAQSDSAATVPETASDSVARDSTTVDTVANETTATDTIIDVTKVSEVVLVDTSVAPPETADDTTTTEPDTAVLAVGGENCADPTLLGDPDQDSHFDVFADVGALSHLRDDYDASSCGITDTSLNGHAKADAVWRFVAPAAGEYRVSLLSDTNIDLILYAFDAGACGTTCLGFDDSGGPADIDGFTLTLAADQEIAVVVDGKAAWHAGAYVLDVYACGAHCN